MEQTPENIAWGMKMFSKLRWMRGFPVEEDSIEDRVRRFVKLVHNKSILEVKRIGIYDYCIDHGWSIVDSRKESDDYKLEPEQVRIFGGPDRNDADWIIEHVGENCNELPSQMEIRQRYARYLEPWDHMKPPPREWD